MDLATAEPLDPHAGPEATRAHNVVVLGLDRASCDSMGRALCEEGGADAVLSAIEPEHCLEEAEAAGAELVLVNLEVGRSSVVELLRRSADTDLRVIVFGAGGSVGLTLQLVESGAAAVIDRAAPFDEIVRTVKSVRSGGTLFGPTVTLRLAERVCELSRLCRRLDRDPAKLDALTKREREVLGVVAEGVTNRQVAQRLFVSVGTVKSHVHRILRKLDVRSRDDAVEFLSIEAARTNGRAGPGVAERPLNGDLTPGRTDGYARADRNRSPKPHRPWVLR